MIPHPSPAPRAEPHGDDRVNRTPIGNGPETHGGRREPPEVTRERTSEVAEGERRAVVPDGADRGRRRDDDADEPRDDRGAPSPRGETDI